jgi:hypothetical protein
MNSIPQNLAYLVARLQQQEAAFGERIERRRAQLAAHLQQAEALLGETVTE